MKRSKSSAWLPVLLLLLFAFSVYGSTLIAAQDEPVTIVFGLEGSPPTFDPVAAADSRVDTPSINLYNALYQYIPGTTELEPELAESVEISEDGLSYTFTLRPDVLFHDGTTVDADDVKYSFDRMTTLSIGVARSFGMVTGTEVIDPLTVRINLSAPFPGFMGAISRMYILNSELVQANTVDDDWGQTWLQNNDAGSGPYTLVSYEPEQQFTIEAFPEYFKGWDGDHIDRAVFRVIREQSTRRLSLETGESHWILVGSPETYDALAANPDFKTYADATLNQLYFAFNTQREELSDVNVRRALALAYDYVGHVEQARNGFAEVARGPLPPAIVCFDESIPASRTDLEEAKALMAQSAYPDGGFTLSMAYQGTSPEETAAMQIWQAGAAELGITISPMAVEWPAKVQAYSSLETAPDLGTIWIYPSLPDPNQFVGLLAATSQQGGGGYNFSYYSNPEMDELIAAGQVELDPEARCEIYRQIQQLWIEEVPYADVVIGQALSASANNVMGYQWNPAHSFTQNVYQMWIES